MIDPRNAQLNAAYQPKTAVPTDPTMVGVPEGDTNYDPFLGTGWGGLLDAMGAKKPGGIKMSGNTDPTSSSLFPMSLQGLRKASGS